VGFGCGDGIDVILASHKVGENGKVVGIDFAPQMIDIAKQAVIDSGFQQRDIELLVADIGKSQLPTDFADAVISHCVINLCPDKNTVYEEAFRVLRPGGRLAISDVVLTKDIDAQWRERFQSTWSGCLGGAIIEESYWDTMGKAGFSEFKMVSRHTLTSTELKEMASCPGEEFTPPPNNEGLEIVQRKVDGVKVTAIEPPPA
jgi:SAM-dependent methyltransferase